MSILLTLAGCVVGGAEPVLEDGTVEVGWEVGASGCEAAGIETVDVAIGGVTGSFPCADGGATLDVPAGDHLVRLDGVDAGGQVRYAGEASVRVAAGEHVVAPTVVLSALPAELTVTWYFENGRLCGQNGVETVELRVFEEDYLVEEREGPCDDGVLTVEALVAGTYDVHLLAVDAGGVGAFAATEVVDLGKGDLVVMELELRAE